MATVPELLDGHVTLEVECLDRLYLDGYIGKLATGLGLSMFMRDQLGKPVPSPVVLGQVSEKFRQSVKALAERESIPIYQFDQVGQASTPAAGLQTRAHVPSCCRRGYPGGRPGPRLLDATREQRQNWAVSSAVLRGAPAAPEPVRTRR